MEVFYSSRTLNRRGYIDKSHLLEHPTQEPYGECLLNNMRLNNRREQSSGMYVFVRRKVCRRFANPSLEVIRVYNLRRVVASSVEVQHINLCTMKLLIGHYTNNMTISLDSHLL